MLCQRTTADQELAQLRFHVNSDFEMASTFIRSVSNTETVLTFACSSVRLVLESEPSQTSYRQRASIPIKTLWEGTRASQYLDRGTVQ